MGPGRPAWALCMNRIRTGQHSILNTQVWHEFVVGLELLSIFASLFVHPHAEGGEGTGALLQGHKGCVFADIMEQPMFELYKYSHTCNIRDCVMA